MEKKKYLFLLMMVEIIVLLDARIDNTYDYEQDDDDYGSGSYYYYYKNDDYDDYRDSDHYGSGYYDSGYDDNEESSSGIPPKHNAYPPIEPERDDLGDQSSEAATATTSVVILEKSVDEINSLIAQSSTSTSTAGSDADDVKKSWTSKVLHLIALYEQHEQDFCNNVIKKKDTWQKVANKLNATGGTQFTADEVDKKWRGLRERYKKIVDSNKQTGRGKSTWEFMEALRPILDKDPAVNPPCVVSAGCVAAVDIREQDVSVPRVSAAGTTTPQASGARTTTPQASGAASTPTTSKRGSRKRKNELSTSLDRFTEEANSRHKNIVTELKALVQEEKRKNDLFEKFLDTVSKK